MSAKGGQESDTEEIQEEQNKETEDKATTKQTEDKATTKQKKDEVKSKQKDDKEKSKQQEEKETRDTEADNKKTQADDNQNEDDSGHTNDSEVQDNTKSQPSKSQNQITSSETYENSPSHEQDENQGLSEVQSLRDDTDTNGKNGEPTELTIDDLTTDHEYGSRDQNIANQSDEDEKREDSNSRQDEQTFSSTQPHNSDENMNKGAETSPTYENGLKQENYSEAVSDDQPSGQKDVPLTDDDKSPSSETKGDAKYPSSETKGDSSPSQKIEDGSNSPLSMKEEEQSLSREAKDEDESPSTIKDVESRSLEIKDETTNENKSPTHAKENVNKNDDQTFEDNVKGSHTSFNENKTFRSDKFEEYLDTNNEENNTRDENDYQDNGRNHQEHSNDEAKSKLKSDDSTENKNYFYISTPGKTDTDYENKINETERSYDDKEQNRMDHKNVDDKNESEHDTIHSDTGMSNKEETDTRNKQSKFDVGEVESKARQQERELGDHEYSDDEFEAEPIKSGNKSKTHVDIDGETTDSNESKLINSKIESRDETDTTRQQTIEKDRSENNTERSNENQVKPTSVELSKTERIKSHNKHETQKEKSDISKSQSPRRIVAEERRQQRRTTQSAEFHRFAGRSSPRRTVHGQQRPKTTGQRSIHSTSYSIGKKKNSKKGKSSTGTNKQAGNHADNGSDGSEAGGKKQREFFKEELRRLQNGLQAEKSKIHKPKERDYYPNVFTSLEPYYNTYVASYLIELNDDQRQGFITRNTAQGLCDPWVDLRMDHEILPKLETGSKPSTTASQRSQKKKSSSKKDKKPKEGSTRLPKFPVVNFNSQKENATKKFPYSEIPQFREEMKQKFSQSSTNRVDQDYTRTKQDFYRMELDKIEEIHPVNRPHMRKAYFAYLQNTPGSRKAIQECAKTLPAN